MKRKYRLRRNSEFQQVRCHGRTLASPIMVLAFLQNDLDYSRFGFVVSKRLGNAVQRNKLKRRMREAARLRLSQVKPGYDLVVIARKQINRASYAEIADSLDCLLQTASIRL